MSKAAAKNLEIANLLRASTTLIWLVSREEERVENGIVQACSLAKRAPYFWDCATGITDGAGATVLAQNGDPTPGPALDYIRRTEGRAVYVLRDFHAWTDPVTVRALKSLARSLQKDPSETKRSIIVLTHRKDIPEELQDLAASVEYPLPDREEIAALLGQTIEILPEDRRAGAAPNGTRDAAIDAATGLSAARAQSAYALSLVTSGAKVDPSKVANEKKRVISAIPGVTWYDPDPRGLDGVAGLDVLKSWLSQRKAAFTPAAREYGLPAPKGAFLVGVPGCGKSLTAKCVASAWGVPLLRLDLGATKSKFVGDSEANIRACLEVAETIGRCVLWLDEIEKALAGASGSQGDGGVSADALGAVLSWMQERTAPVFVIATANDVRALPPELLRKGRFDEVFWIDLPNVAERRAILDVTLRAHGRSADGIDLAQLAERTDGFAGAEIAAIVPEALFAAFADGARPLSTADLVSAASTVVPLKDTAAEKIKDLRAWATGRARAASSKETIAPVKRTGAGALDL